MKHGICDTGALGLRGDLVYYLTHSRLKSYFWSIPWSLGYRLPSGNVEEWLLVLAGSLLLGSVKSGKDSPSQSYLYPCLSLPETKVSPRPGQAQSCVNGVELCVHSWLNEPNILLCTMKKYQLNQGWRHMPVIPACGGRVGSSRLALAT